MTVPNEIAHRRAGSAADGASGAATKHLLKGPEMIPIATTDDGQMFVRVMARNLPAAEQGCSGAGDARTD